MMLLVGLFLLTIELLLLSLQITVVQTHVKTMPRVPTCQAATTAAAFPDTKERTAPKVRDRFSRMFLQTVCVREAGN